MIARYLCIPPSTVETFGEKISAKACSGKEIAGLEEADDTDGETKIVKSRVSAWQTGGR